MNNKKGTIIIGILVVILCAVLFVGIKKDRDLSKQNEMDYIASLSNKSKEEKEKEDKKEEEDKSIENNEKKEENENTEKNKVEDFYSKLKNKEAVRVLVLGDGIALSQGHSTENGVWDKQVAAFLEKTYGSKVELTSLARSGATTAKGLEIVNGNNIDNYDLVLTCFGQNDNNSQVNVNNTKSNYENMINKIKTQNPNSEVIMIIPNTLSLDNAYRTAIINLSKEKELKIADMKKAFSEADVPEQSLILNTIPNENGYKLYVKTITNIIESSVR